MILQLLGKKWSRQVANMWDLLRSLFTSHVKGEHQRSLVCILVQIVDIIDVSKAASTT